VTSPLAQLMQQLHPLRLQYEWFSNANPFMAPVAALAEQVRNNRSPVAADNPFVALQETVSGQIVAALDAWRNASETLAERTFMAVYGSPALQAAVGIDSTATQWRAAKHPWRRELLQKRIGELRARIPVGGLREAVVRALIYTGLGRASVDERGFETVRRIRRANGDLPLAEFKSLVREQFLILLVDTDAALAALSSMLPADADLRRKGFEVIEQVMSARGTLSAEDNARMLRVARAFGLEEEKTAGTAHLSIVPSEPEDVRAKAS
jgi:hypothetical protein